MTDVDLDDLAARVDALSRARTHLLERVDALEQENAELRDRVGRLEAVVDTDPTKLEYEALTKERKVHRVRSKLVAIAENTNGRAAMDYDDVMALFDGHPSRGHAYDLMRAAGEGLAGFDYQERSGKKDRVRVKSDAVNDVEMFHGVTTPAGGEVP